jgi:hypothetical protein
MVRNIILTASLLIASAGAGTPSARAVELPRYNSEANCRAKAIGSQGADARLFKACMQVERESLATLGKATSWGALAGRAQNACISGMSAYAEADYSALLDCVEASLPVAPR